MRVKQESHTSVTTHNVKLLYKVSRCQMYLSCSNKMIEETEQGSHFCWSNADESDFWSPLLP